jgi:hypothetical protein
MPNQKRNTAAGALQSKMKKFFLGTSQCPTGVPPDFGEQKGKMRPRKNTE